MQHRQGRSLTVVSARLGVLLVTALVAGVGGIWLYLALGLGLGFYREGSVPSGVSIDSVRIPVAGGEVAGTLFRPAAAGAAMAPGVVLVHGTSPQGRSLLLYQILARKLAASGAVVILYDQRGYGESPDPAIGRDGRYELPWVADAVEVSEFLGDLPIVDRRDMRLLGHSFGGSIAIGVSQVPGIACLLGRVLVLSPGRGLNQAGSDPFAFRAERLSADMLLDPPLGRDDAQLMYATMEVESLLAGTSGVPATLLHTEDEEEARPLEPFVTQSASAIPFRILPGTEHYFGTRRAFNSWPLPFKVYDARPLRLLIAEVLAAAPVATRDCPSSTARTRDN